VMAGAASAVTGPLRVIVAAAGHEPGTAGPKGVTR